MIAVAALLIVAAVPALAASREDHGERGNPGGDRGASAEHIGTRGGGSEGDSETGPPEWAKAYGWRIKDTFFGLPYGQLLRCAEAETPSEACPIILGFPDFPEGEDGARAFWVSTGIGTNIVGL